MISHLNKLSVYCLITFLTTLPLSVPSHADVKPNTLFSDNAVLQQGVKVPVWGTAENGENVTVEFSGQKVSTTAVEGKWRIDLAPLKASDKPLIMTITGKNKVALTNVLVGEVWVASGQSNMERELGLRRGQKPIDNWRQEVAAANYPAIRQFAVPQIATNQPATDVNGSWTLCSPQTAAKFSAVGYFFARDLHQKLHVPIGILFTSWGGTPAEAWTGRSVFEGIPELRQALQNWDQAQQSFPEKLAAYQQAESAALAKWQTEVDVAKQASKPLPRKPAPPINPANSPNAPTTLYNGMIAPLQPYAIRGVVWYQGESNSGRGKQYRTLFPAMISDWRATWREGDFPFLFVQIAPFDAPNRPENDPAVREAQLLTLGKTLDTAMVVTTDIGNAADIHPPHKQAVGARLALAAQVLAYGEKLEYSGPLFDSMTIEGNRAILKFTHVGGGLIEKDGPLKGFLIAGSDNQFVPAKAEIRGDEVVVSGDQIFLPVTVRYGWAKAPDVNLFNKEGLPASPFRTDSK